MRLPGALLVPGHTPTQEDSAFWRWGKVAALGPTSAIIWSAESTPKPGTSDTRAAQPRGAPEVSSSASRSSCSMCVSSKLQFLEYHLEQPTIHVHSICAHAPNALRNSSGVARRRRSARVAKAARIGFAFCQSLQHAPRTDTQKIRHKAR